jgi:hypothetical protein
MYALKRKDYESIDCILLYLAKDSSLLNRISLFGSLEGRILDVTYTFNIFIENPLFGTSSDELLTVNNDISHLYYLNLLATYGAVGTLFIMIALLTSLNINQFWKFEFNSTQLIQFYCLYILFFAPLNYVFIIGALLINANKITHNHS